MIKDGAHASEQMEPGVHPRLGRALEETGGAPQPPCADRRCHAAEEYVSEKKGRASGFDGSAGLHVASERPLERIGRLVGPARPPGGLAHELEVLGRKNLFAIGRGESLHCLRPGVALDGVPA